VPRACRHGGVTELEEAELTDGQGRVLSAHKSRAYEGCAKRTMERALAATRKRRAHRLTNATGTDVQNDPQNRVQNDFGDESKPRYRPGKNKDLLAAGAGFEPATLSRYGRLRASFTKREVVQTGARQARPCVCGEQRLGYETRSARRPAAVSARDRDPAPPSDSPPARTRSAPIAQAFSGKTTNAGRTENRARLYQARLHPIQ
jgi:hypothetical protein